MDAYYDWFKAGHVISVIAWMAGILYLPRLFSYHTEVKNGSSEDKRFHIMEERLLRIIMNPAMVFTIVFGLLMASIYGWFNFGFWFHIKVLFVLLMAMFHMFLAYCRKKFITGKNNYSKNFYRIINEVPTIMMIIIVILVVVKPFE